MNVAYRTSLVTYCYLSGDPAITKRALTAAAVDRIRPPAKGQADHFDAGYPGLALRISVGGSRSWVHFYRVYGKQRRQTLGQYPSMSLSDARAAWRKTREIVDSGQDPLRNRSLPADTFEAVAAEWLKRDQAGNRSYAEVARVMARDVCPRWPAMKISQIRKPDIAELIDEIADRGAVTYARRVHAHLHRLFRWSVGRGLLEVNPMADLPKPGSAVTRVGDNGIGMSVGHDAPKAGLGTGIVEALVKNLRGEIQLSDAGPGTAVTIRHGESAGVRTGLSAAA